MKGKRRAGPHEIADEIAEPAAVYGRRSSSASPEVLHLAFRLLQAETERRSRMDAIIESMLPQIEIPGPAIVLQARRNAEARQALLSEFGGLTSTEVADLAGSRAANRAALAHRWKQEGKVFAVTYGAGTYFPAFQFDAAGQPKPAIAAVIAALGDEVTDWQRALWFTTANGWLGGRRPVDLLDGDPAATAALVASATHVGEGLVY